MLSLVEGKSHPSSLLLRFSIQTLKSSSEHWPSVPPFPSTKFGHKSLGDNESNSASGEPVELTVTTVPREEAVLPKNPLTKF